MLKKPIQNRTIMQSTIYYSPAELRRRIDFKLEQLALAKRRATPPNELRSIHKSLKKLRLQLKEAEATGAGIQTTIFHK